MDTVFFLPVIGLALWVFGGIIMIWRSRRIDLDDLWGKHAARYLAEGLHVERTPEWEKNITRWMRVQFWLGVIIIILFGSLIPLYFYFIHSEGFMK